MSRPPDFRVKSYRQTVSAVFRHQGNVFQSVSANAPGTGDLGRLAAVEPQNTNILIIDDDPGLRELLECHQGEQITRQPLVIVLLAVPILIQIYFNSGLAYLLNRKLGVVHCVAGPSALIEANNFFELAVAMAIVLFGFESGAALATVVDVLIEVPVMLSVMSIVNSTQHWYEAA